MIEASCISTDYVGVERDAFKRAVKSRKHLSYSIGSNMIYLY